MVKVGLSVLMVVLVRVTGKMVAWIRYYNYEFTMNASSSSAAAAASSSSNINMFLLLVISVLFMYVVSNIQLNIYHHYILQF